jgi:hypothetical protein
MGVRSNVISKNYFEGIKGEYHGSGKTLRFEARRGYSAKKSPWGDWLLSPRSNALLSQPNFLSETMDSRGCTIVVHIPENHKNYG